MSIHRCLQREIEIWGLFCKKNMITNKETNKQTKRQNHKTENNKVRVSSVCDKNTFLPPARPHSRRSCRCTHLPLVHHHSRRSYRCTDTYLWYITTVGDLTGVETLTSGTSPQSEILQVYRPLPLGHPHSQRSCRCRDTYLLYITTVGDHAGVETLTSCTSPQSEIFLV
jgi:hypothetical protein